jgi:hypothetical protein
MIEQHVGNLRIFDPTNNSLLPTPFLTIDGLTKDSEQGLLGIAFHPQFETKVFLCELHFS